MVKHVHRLTYWICKVDKMFRLPPIQSGKKGNGEGEPRLEVVPYWLEIEKAQWWGWEKPDGSCGVVVISWTTLLLESVPNYNCNSRGLLKTLRGYRATLPRFQRQFCPWSWVSMETSFFWKRDNRTCFIGLLILYDHVKVSIPLFCLLSISNTQSRICQCAWMTTESKCWGFVNWLCLY